MPSRHGTGEGGPFPGDSGADGRRPCLTPSWPIHLPRRWFSIQNSQLVYQKKLKVRCRAPHRAPGWAGQRGSHRTEDTAGTESTWGSDGPCLRGGASGGWAGPGASARAACAACRTC